MISPFQRARDARAAGVKRYFNGRACSEGHISERLVSTNGCCECARLRAQRRNEFFKSAPRDDRQVVLRRLVSRRARARKSPEELYQIENVRRAKKALRDKERVARRPRPDSCEICGYRGKQKIVFDHSHTHGKFRGWLCDRCNKVLGLSRDDPFLLTGLAWYLELDAARQTGVLSLHGERICGRESAQAERRGLMKPDDLPISFLSFGT